MGYMSPARPLSAPTAKDRRLDEAYALALCDEIIGTPSIREARFDWLLGDPGKNGTRRRLPVDAYWPRLGLIIEFWEYQHDSPTPFFDKPDLLTVSGVPRNVQRAIYDQRRQELIPQHGLKLLIIRKADLTVNSRGRLTYDRQGDLAKIRKMIAEILPRT